MMARTPEASSVDPTLRERLERAAEGLVYTSEADHPFAFFALPWPDEEPLTPAAFAARVGAAPGEPAAEVTLDHFLAQHIGAADPADERAQQLRPRYERLRDALRESLRDLRVFRIGEVEIRCYAVGRDGRGSLVGLATVAVET